MSTKKTGTFLSHAGPHHRNLYRPAFVGFCLLLFRKSSGLVTGELLGADVIVRYVSFTQYLTHAGDHSRRASYVEN
jgi:hypothetical protein